MRSICSLTLLVLCFSCSDSKQQEASRELREVAALESALTAVSASPPEDRPQRLKDVEALKINSPRVLKVRARCVEGYRAFLDATAQMVEARQHVRRIEAEAKKALSGPGPLDLDASAGELASLHATAVIATENLDEALSRAEELVRECTEMRIALAADLGTN